MTARGFCTWLRTGAATEELLELVDAIDYNHVKGDFFNNELLAYDALDGLSRLSRSSKFWVEAGILHHPPPTE